ncbi:MAG: ATP-binding protein, partial [Spirochaetales bacterium]|nr:ATP-binding protein [Spirochaetales bacterium]
LETMVDERTQQLSIENEKAKQSDMLKTVFLGNISHEIRNPVNAIIGFSELIKNNAVPPELIGSYLDLIINSGKSLLDIVNNIIDVSRLETGTCEIVKEEFELYVLIEDSLASVKDNSKVLKKRVELIHEVDSSKEITLNSDKTKIQQIITNLLNNAVKYTTEGSVYVGYYFAGENINIFVKDTGSGIAPEELDCIFERFGKVEPRPYSSGGGLGIGLTIARGYAEMLGGELLVESRLNEGSIFTFSIPFKAISNN